MTSASLLPLASGFPPADDAQWRTLVEKVLKGADFRKRLVSRTADGIEIEPLYTRPASASAAETDADALTATRTSGLRLRQHGWRIGQMRAEDTPSALSAAALDDIENGADTITIRLASPGYVGGIPAEISAIEAALAPLPLDRIRVAIEPGVHASRLTTPLLDLARRRNALGNIARLGIDPLGTLARAGTLVGLKTDGLGLAVGPSPLTSLLQEAAFTGALLTADACPYHEAGASEAQEIAALAATLVAYLRALEAEGLPPIEALGRISLSMAADADIFLTIAKLRAARRVVARIAEACQASASASQMSLAVTTSERMMARRDPWVNMLRVTAACAAAAMGGADEITVLPYTWALGAPDAFASRIARNVGIVLREESGLGRIIDPAGGAWAVEALTDELAAKAWGVFQAWERAGGMLAALRSGLVQGDIASVAGARAKDIPTRRIELTGVSAFPQIGDDGVKVTPWPAASTLPSTPYASPLAPIRLAAPFERLRDLADAAAAPPRVFLASLGPQAEHAARSTWVANLLAAGGIGVIAGDGFTSSTEAGRAFAESGATIACICGTDQTYSELAEATAMALKGAGAARVYLAGRPRDEEAAQRAAGVDGFLFNGIDVVAALAGLLHELGADD